MFAAMCENPKFFQEKMNAFIAIAPVVNLTNMGSEFLQKVARNDLVMDNLKSLSSEILPFAVAGNSKTRL